MNPEDVERIIYEQRQTLARLGLPEEPIVKAKKGRPKQKRIKGSEETSTSVGGCGAIKDLTQVV
jgi:hypothetical protein